MTKTRTRLDWIDAAKGIGIALVVLGHAARHDMMAQNDLCGVLAYLIYSFHMPLYFAISGCTFGLSYGRYLEKSALFLKRRAKGLLVPMLSYACAVYLCFFAASQIPPVARILENASYELCGFGRYLALMLVEENPYSVHLWYLWVLFWMSTLSFLWLRQGKDSPAAHWGLGAVALLCFGVSTVADTPDAVHKFLCHYVYFVLGMELGRRPQALRPVPWVVAALCWGVLLVNAPIVRSGFLKVLPWALVIQKFLLLAVVPPVILGFFNLAKKWERSKPLQWLGRESYAIYLLHQPLCAFAGVLLYGKLGLPVWPVYLFCAVLSVAVPELVVWLCRKVKPVGRVAEIFLNIS